MGRRDPSFRGSPISTARVLFISLAPKDPRRAFTHSSPVPRAGPVGSKGVAVTFSVHARLRRPSDPALRSCRRRARLCNPLHLLPSPRDPATAAVPRAAEAAAPSPTRPILVWPGTLETVAPRTRTQVRWPKFSAQGCRETRGCGDPKSTYLELWPPGPPQLERGAALRALPEGAQSREGSPEAANARRPHRGSQSAGGGAAAALPSPASGARGEGRLRSLRACRLPLDPWPAHRPAPASHGPARPPPRPTPAPGGNLKPRLRHLRQPPPATGRRPACLGFAPRARSAEASGDWRGPTRPEEGEGAPWWRRLSLWGSHRLRLGATCGRSWPTRS